MPSDESVDIEAKEDSVLTEESLEPWVTKAGRVVAIPSSSVAEGEIGGGSWLVSITKQ